jgi:hypothetical protein
MVESGTREVMDERHAEVVMKAFVWAAMNLPA